MQIEQNMAFMRISVDIDESILEEAMALTGEKNKSPALAKAVTEYVRRQRAKEFGQLIRESAFDYPSQKSKDGQDPANPMPPLFEK